MCAGTKALLQILVERVQRARGIDEVVIATTVNAADDPIVKLAHDLGVGVFRGSERDVLGRVAGTLRAFAADICVEITGDCPLVDPLIIEEALREFHSSGNVHPYVSNSDPHRAVPAGLDVQVFWAKSLFQLEVEATDPRDREHVSYGFYRPETSDRWRPRFITHKATRGAENLWVTLDYQEDYEMIRRIYEDLTPRMPMFGAADVIGWIRTNPEAHDRCTRRRSALRTRWRVGLLGAGMMAQGSIVQILLMCLAWLMRSAVRIDS